jgi:hypothetical protein
VREMTLGASEASAGITVWRRNALRLGRMPASCRCEAPTPLGLVAPPRICDRVLFQVLITHPRFHDALRTIDAPALYPGNLPTDIMLTACFHLIVTRQSVHPVPALAPETRTGRRFAATDGAVPGLKSVPPCGSTQRARVRVAGVESSSPQHSWPGTPATRTPDSAGPSRAQPCYGSA